MHPLFFIVAFFSLLLALFTESSLILSRDTPMTFRDWCAVLILSALIVFTLLMGAAT